MSLAELFYRKHPQPSIWSRFRRASGARDSSFVNRHSIFGVNGSAFSVPGSASTTRYLSSVTRHSRADSDASRVTPHASRLFFEALEPRLLLSAAPVPEGAELPALSTQLSAEAAVSADVPVSDAVPSLVADAVPLEPLATTFFVITAADAGPGSLRQAIQDANAAAGTDTIAFAVPGAGVQSIALLSALPAITDSVIIDGTTQPGYAGTPLLELNGAGAGTGVDGFRVTANNTAIRGLIINRFSGNGIRLENSTGSLIDGNFIGTDATGTTSQGNGGDGISLLNSSNTRIGGEVSGLVSLWSGDGTARDTVGSNNGSLVGGATFVDGGKFGQAFTFDGNGDFVQVPDANNLSPHVGADGEMTISAWVNVQQLPANTGSARSPIVAKGAPNQWEYSLNVHADGSLSFRVWNLNGEIYALAPGGRVSVNEWHHVAGVLKKGQVATLYVDGLYAGQDTSFLGTTGNGSAPFFIGRRGDNEPFLNGAVDEVALFNRVLTPAEIQVLARKPVYDLGRGNRIAFNAGDGIGVSGAAGTAAGNFMSGNRLFFNGELGIDLNDNGVTANDVGDGDTGPNGLQNFPVVTSANVDEVFRTVVVSGTLNSTPSTPFRVEFFSGQTADTSGFGEGHTYVGSTTVTTDAAGNATFTDVSFIADGPVGQAVTVTATNLLTGNTSELSRTLGVPRLDLDGDNSSGAIISDYASSWTFGLGPVLIADRDATITDSDSATLQSMTIVLTNRPNGNAAESLAAMTTGTPITAGYTSSTGVLSLTGTATLSQYEQVLRTVRYHNTAAAPNATQRVITVVANDGANVSEPATARLDIGTVLTVTTTNDAGIGSLRQAITTANSNGPGKDRIVFNIAGAGVKTITPLTALPTITSPVIIDATTQTGYVPGSPVIVLDGINAGNAATGLVIAGGNTTVTGFTITRFGDSGLILQSDSNVIDNNVISSNGFGGAPFLIRSGVGIDFSSNNRIGQTSPGLVGFWSGDGTANDSQGQNHGALFNGATFVPGQVGQAFKFDGANDYFQAPDAGNLSPHAPADGEMTVAAWVNVAQLPPASGNARSPIVAKGGPNQWEYSLNVQATGALSFRVWNPDGNFYAQPVMGGMISLNQWHHVAGVLKKGEFARLYVDGALVATQTTFSGITADGTSPFYIGRRGDNEPFLNGAVDEVVVFNRALSAEELQAFAAGSRVGVGNQISANNLDGIQINSESGHLIQGNRIFSNGRLGINAGFDTVVTDNDPGDLNAPQNFPVLTSALVTGGQLTITGSLNSLPNTSYRIEFFSNPVADVSGAGEGLAPLGSVTVTTNGTGNALFRQVLMASNVSNQFITALATNLITRDTSEFSKALAVTAGVPLLDLDLDNNSGQSGSGYRTSWTQGLGPVRIADADAIATDPDNATLQSLTITLTNRPNGTSEVLDATVAGTGISENYNSSTGVYALTGTASVALYQQVLRTATYNNTAATPSGAPRIITVAATDGMNVSTTATAQVDIGRLYTVNDTGDQPDANPGDGVALTSTGTTTFRAAIQEANSGPGKDRIVFNVSGAGIRTITPLSPLPTLTSPVVIDGTTQPGFSGTPLIELSGANAGGNANGLFLMGGNSLIRGLIINRFGTGNGILIQTGGGNLIEGNWIGVTATGTGVSANQDGIEVLSSSNNVIGGTTAAARNVISGNTQMGVRIAGTSSFNELIGNFIGTNTAGTAAVGNGDNGVYILDPSNNNVVGGLTAAHRNIISGNQDGIHIESGTGATRLNNLIRGNYIGTDVTGTLDLGNTQKGVRIQGASGNLIEAGNVISGNNQEGVLISGAAATANLVRSNLIGMKADGVTALGNTGAGVLLSVSGPNTSQGISLSAGNVIGGSELSDGNTIGFNGGPGVSVTRTGITDPIDPDDADPSGTRNAIVGNRIFNNGSLGIDLGADGMTGNDTTTSGPHDGDFGPNNRQNFPVLSGALISGSTVTMTGTLSSQANKRYLLEFYANPDQGASVLYEGQRFLGRAAVLTNGSGNAPFSVTLDAAVAVGERITATAAEVEKTPLVDDEGFSLFDSRGNDLFRMAGSSTSEFSASIQAASGISTVPLTIRVNGSGLGRVQSTPAGIDLTRELDEDGFPRNVGDASELYSFGALVTLTATPTNGSLFAGWTGFGISGSTMTDPNPTLTVSVTEARTYTATFLATAQESIRQTLQFLEAVSFWPGTVTLTWLKATQSGLSGYRVYSGQSSGVYGPSFGVGQSVTSVTFTNLPTVPHFFAVTPVISGQESGFSNEVSVTPIAGLEAYRAVDEGTADGPSDWSGEQSPVAGQFSPIGSPDDITATQRGTLLFLTDGFPQRRTDYELTLTLRSQDEGALGTTFRYVDPNNYYRFSMDRDPNHVGRLEDGYRRLVKMKDGIATILWEQTIRGIDFGGDGVIENVNRPLDTAEGAYRPNQLYIVTINTEGPTLSVSLREDGGVILLNAFDTMIEDFDFSGSGFGLYSEQNAGGFYDVVGANFGPQDPSLVGLLVNVTGTGRGTITSRVNGVTASLASPGSPAATFVPGTLVMLTAASRAGSRFGGWYLNGELQTLNANLTVMTTQSAVYEALFTPNAAPTGQNRTIPITEDSPYTFTVLDFGFTDADMGDTLNAVRIDTLSLGGGTLRLNGANVTTGQLIPAADLSNLVFLPASNVNGNAIANFTFSVQDSALTFDLSPNAITFNVTALNDAPVLDASKTPVLAAVDEDASPPSGPVGTLVSALVDLTVPASGLDNVTDVDAGAVTGLAITAVETTNADWFFSTNDGATWTALGSVSTSSARLLAADANTWLYAQPKSRNFNGTIANAITFRAWDRSNGANGGTADTTTNGSATAFSRATDTAVLTVNPVNDAPVLNAIGSKTVVEGQPLTFTATASDVDTPAELLQYSLAPGEPDGAVINSSSGEFTWTPTDAQGPGSYQVRVIVSDGVFSAEQLVPITVHSSVTLDIDGDGSANATDGTLIVRYLAGLPDRQLVAGLTVAGTSTPMDGETIRRRIDDMMLREPLMLDADGDGQLNPFTDGRLIARFLVDQENGPSLTGAVQGPNASRTTSADIRAFLSQFLPVPASVPSAPLAAESSVVSSQLSVSAPHPAPRTSNPAPAAEPSAVGYQLSVSSAWLSDGSDEPLDAVPFRPWLQDFVGSSAVTDDPNRDLLVTV